MNNWNKIVVRALSGLCMLATVTCLPTMAAETHGRHEHAGGKHAQERAERAAGFLVAAPDRGFMGNEEIRDAFDAFAKIHNAELVYVTDGRTHETAGAALAALAKRGARQVTVLPLFYSVHEARYGIARAALEGKQPLPIDWAAPFGASYFAVEALTERLRALGDQKGKRLVVAGSGAADQAAAGRIAADLQRLAQFAAPAFAYAGVDVAVWPDGRGSAQEAVQAQAQAALKERAGAIVVPLHFARKLDSMMNFSQTLKSATPAASLLLAEEALTPLALTWMRREANRKLPLADGQTGVVIAAHGSDWHWNDTMQSAVRPLEKRYLVEYAFSMADGPVLERAVRRLNERGARRVVIVRVFGTHDSFRSDIERLIGQDVEAADGHVQGHGGGHGHGHGNAGPLTRIRSSAVLTSAGGMGDHPLFARALVERAKALSRDPKKETIILTAHGTNDDAANDRWVTLLESIAAKMRENGGAAFRDIRVATWREDWPAKREQWVDRVRNWVSEANRDGAAIVIPARTNGAGPEKQLLSGLDYRLGSGFAPHPLFVRWVEEQVALGLAGGAPGAPAHRHH